MPDIIKTIGTDGRDYSTLQLWEADLDEGAIYSSGDTAIGQIYNDSVFDEALFIDSGDSVGLSNVILTVPESERHDGTAGTGARIVASGASRRIRLDTGVTKTVEWLELDNNGFSAGGATEGSFYFNSDNTCFIKNCIAHDNLSADTTRLFYYRIGGSGIIMNCIGYDVTSNTGATGARPAVCFQSASVGGRNSKFYNCTGYKAIGDNQNKESYIFAPADVSGSEIINCVGTDPSGTGSGDHDCFIPSSPSNITMTHNVSSDSTASGTGSITSVDSADLFISTVDGSEDFHLISASDCIDAGTDLGTTPSGVEIDINGRNRDIQDDIWDIGAHEFVGDVTSTDNAIFFGHAF